jgi:hypothetical protein
MALPLRIASSILEQGADAVTSSMKNAVVGPISSAISTTLGPFSGISNVVTKAIKDAQAADKKSANDRGDIKASNEKIAKSSTENTTLMNSMLHQLKILNKSIIGMNEKMESAQREQVLNPISDSIVESGIGSVGGLEEVTDAIKTQTREDKKQAAAEDGLEKRLSQEEQDAIKDAGDDSQGFLTKLVNLAVKGAVAAVGIAALPALITSDREQFETNVRNDAESMMQGPRLPQDSNSVVDAERKDLQGQTPLREMGMQNKQRDESREEYNARRKAASENYNRNNDFESRKEAFKTSAPPPSGEVDETTTVDYKDKEFKQERDKKGNVIRTVVNEKILDIKPIEKDIGPAVAAAMPPAPVPMPAAVQSSIPVSPTNTSTPAAAPTAVAAPASLPEGVTKDNITGMYRSTAYNAEKDGYYSKSFKTPDEAVKYIDNGMKAANENMKGIEADFEAYLDKQESTKPDLSPASATPVPSQGPKAKTMAVQDNALQSTTQQAPPIIVQNNTNNTSTQNSPTITSGGGEKASVPLN